MIAAEDEWAWEGDPDACQERFAKVRAEREGEGLIVREIEIVIDQEKVEQAFRVSTVAGEIA